MASPGGDGRAVGGTAVLRPALTPEEWAMVAAVRAGKMIGGRFVGRYSNYMLTGPEKSFVGAAILLHEQPFGFWPFLPKTLRIAAEKLRVLTDSPKDWGDLDVAAFRIEMLLPPETS